MSDHGIEYRSYQRDARDAAFSAFTEEQIPSALVVMPTGTGKTVLAGMCVEEARYGHGLKTLFVAHRETLVTQAHDTFIRFGFDAHIEMAGQNSIRQEALVGEADVVVGSVQTLQDDRLMRHKSDEFGLIIIDECHRSVTDMYTKMLNWFHGYHLLGITATPRRGDDRNLGSRFQKKVYEYRLRAAIEEGWLAEIRTRTCPISIDLRGIALPKGSDYPIGVLEEIIGPKIEILARAFLAEIGKRPFVAFTPDVASAMAFAQVCTELGIPTEYVAGSAGRFGMPKAEKKEKLRKIQAGEIQGVVCCELLIEGWDCPRIAAVGICRPTTQQYRYTQMVGRGTRPSPQTGKTNCLVVDFDWQTDSDAKDLCSVVDLFDDGTLNEDVFAIAKQLHRERAVDTDPIDVIEEAERIIRTRDRFAVKLTGKEAKYAAWEHDPVGVSKILDINLNRKYDLDRKGDNPATPGQIEYLRGLGVDNPETMSKWGASKVINKLVKRRNDGLASATQVQALLVAGANKEFARVMTAVQARDAIMEIDAVTLKQRDLF